MKSIPDGSIDAIITDPPYGTTACKWDSVIPFEPMWEELKRIIKPNGAIVLFGSQPFSSALIMSNYKMFKYELIWDKVQGKQPFLAKIQPMKSHENLLIFAKNKINYNPQMSIGKPYTDKRKGQIAKTEHYTKFERQGYENKSERYPISILKYNNPNTAGMHPTQKPVALLEYLVKTYTNENETVLDFTMGSGTTGVACKNLNRNFIGIELDDKYFEIAKSRIGTY
jgi:site-specific DNA-methyltransferase (adenine-specific)